MGDDVICIDSDEDDEDDAPRRGGGRGARGKRSAGGYWRRQRRIGRARKKWNRHDACHQFIGAPQWLVEALGRLGSSMCFGPGRRNLSPEAVCQAAEHLRKLAGRLQGRHTDASGHTPTNAEQTEGWRHVLKFLLLLRTAGREDMPTGHAEFTPTRIGSKRLRVRQTRRYQLTVIDILVDYIRFRCESVATGQRQPQASAASLLGECNSIVSSLFVVFEGDTQSVTLTLLRAVLEPRYTLLLYPVFESILTDAGCGSPAGPVTGSVTRYTTTTTIPQYVALLLCFKRWKSLAVTRADRASIERHAVRFLPTRCPTIQLASDVPFLLLLPSVPTKQRAHETRFLLANDLFGVERCIDQYVRHYRQYTAQKAQQPAHNTGHRHRLQHRSLEIRSNYINVAVLAELIERKVRLWNNRLTCQDPEVVPPAGVDPLSPLRQEASSIVESLRLIFRHGTEFSELTLLHVVPECGPSASEPLLAAVFEAFLAPDPVAVPISNHLDRPDHHPTGLTVYRSNDVETYVRLVLCYAKWKALCRHQELRGERGRIDGIALSQLPHDCPRAICPRDALLRRILYGSEPGTMLASNRSTLTGFLLRTLPDRSDLQELCFKFLDAYRNGSYATTPSEDTTQQQDAVRSTRAAYKSAASVGGQQLAVTECPGHTNDTQAAPGQPCEGPPGPEMKPIIIPDSDGLRRADGISVPDRTLKPMLTRDQEAFVSIPAVSGYAGDILTTATDVDLAPCPPMAECFLNTPPATPQQDAASEVPGEEDRRNVLVRRHPARCSGRWRGTIRTIQPRKKRNSIHASTVRRTTLGRPLHDGRWWSFADVLAVQSPAERRVPIAVRWSSALKIGLRPPNRVVSNLTIGGTQLNPPPPQLAPNDPSSGDALLLQLIDSLGDGVPSDTTAAKQGAVDFTILADNPHDSMEHQAPPSGPIDTSAIFGDGDQTVLLFTEQGPICWPIV